MPSVCKYHASIPAAVSARQRYNMLKGRSHRPESPHRIHTATETSQGPQAKMTAQGTRAQGKSNKSQKSSKNNNKDVEISQEIIMISRNDSQKACTREKAKSSKTDLNVYQIKN